MGALVAYASSDEEDEVLSQPEAKDLERPQETRQPPKSSATTQLVSQEDDSQQDAPQPGPEPATQPAQIGPSLPPPGDIPLTSGDDALLEDGYADPGRPPQSPYSANRSVIHDLTLPSVPDFDIPPSPPGSPPPALSHKSSQFLELKKKGVHFNQKLENSAALKNPNVMDKLMRFVELDGPSQYQTTLSKSLWNPEGFPEWAHRDNLRKAREQIVKEREAQNATGARRAPEFVPASNARKAG